MKKVKNILFSIFAFGCLIHVWYYAVGSFYVWGKGKVRVWKNRQCFAMGFQFKFSDKYNWDKNKDVSIGGTVVTDMYMGEFHRQGLAREFYMYGNIFEHKSWKLNDLYDDTSN